MLWPNGWPAWATEQSLPACLPSSDGRCHWWRSNSLTGKLLVRCRSHLVRTRCAFQQCKVTHHWPVLMRRLYSSPARPPDLHTGREPLLRVALSTLRLRPTFCRVTSRKNTWWSSSALGRSYASAATVARAQRAGRKEAGLLRARPRFLLRRRLPTARLWAAVRCRLLRRSLRLSSEPSLSSSSERWPFRQPTPPLLASVVTSMLSAVACQRSTTTRIGIRQCGLSLDDSPTAGRGYYPLQTV